MTMTIEAQDPLAGVSLQRYADEVTPIFEALFREVNQPSPLPQRRPELVRTYAEPHEVLDLEPEPMSLEGWLDRRVAAARSAWRRARRYVRRYFS